jgi:hypothetical protein
MEREDDGAIGTIVVIFGIDGSTIEDKMSNHQALLLEACASLAANSATSKRHNPVTNL